ncbi:MAG: FkbM family methyltransferase [Pseudomonadota bacterium]
MKKVGDFWVPDVDMSRFSRFGKNRRKTIRYYSEGGPKLEDLIEVLALLPPGRLAIDGGANVGAYSRMLADKFERVMAFEPSRDTFEALQANIEDWGLADRVQTFNAALTDHCGTVGMKLNWGRRSLSRRVEGAGTIAAITVDSLNVDEVDFIKLDVEGSEYAALVGARHTLAACKPAILFEDKPGKRDLNDVARDPHRYLIATGAESRGAFGRGKFDWLYAFPGKPPTAEPV